MEKHSTVENLSKGISGCLESMIKFHASINKPLPVNNKTTEYFTSLISDFVNTAVEEGEIDGFVLYGIHDLSPLHLSYGVFISGTEYLCFLKENENGKLDLTVKEK